MHFVVVASIWLLNSSDGLENWLVVVHALHTSYNFMTAQIQNDHNKFIKIDYVSLKIYFPKHLSKML